MKGWEAICRRCGLCCYEKRRTPHGPAINLSAPCPYLDRKTRLCTVYGDRFSVCSTCDKVTLLHALFSPWLPDSCGYVRRFRIWRRSSNPPLPPG